MSDNNFYSDDPTDKMPPREPSQPNQQGKLIIGSFQDSPKRPDRKPYQFSPQPPSPEQQADPPIAYPQRPSVTPYGNQGQPVQPVRPIPPSSYPQPQAFPANSGQPMANPPRQPVPSYPYQGQPAQSVQPGQPSPSAMYVSPGSPGAPSYPAHQPGQMPGSPAPGLPRKMGKRPLRKRRGCLISMLVVLVLLIVFVSFAVVTLQKVLAFGSAISTQKSALSTQTDYMGISDRVNILVMGYGGGGHQGAYLTDSMMIMSLLPQSHHTTLISVPRDLWVQVPSGSGNYQKINSVYEVGSNNNANPAAGGNAAAQKISLITGLNVQYWLTINFQGFRGFINAIGGVDVYVPNSFNACYPKNDDASIDASWIKIQFNKGMQHMDGNTAIEYARAREPLEVCGKGTSMNPAELTDFARSARQQIIIKAALSKVKDMGTWPHLYSALDALQHTIYSNLSLVDLAQFALHMDLNGAHRVGLSNQNVLVDATSNDGQFILLPANNNWQTIIDYVKQQLYN